MSLAILIPLVVAIVGAVATYFGAVKKLSGTVATSTAEDLWTESRQMRQDLSDRITTLQTLTDKLLVENTRLRGEIEGLRVELLKMRMKYEDGL